MLDIGVKFENEADREVYCALAVSDQALLESDPPYTYANSIGSALSVAVLSRHELSGGMVADPGICRTHELAGSAVRRGKD